MKSKYFGIFIMKILNFKSEKTVSEKNAYFKKYST